MGNCHSGPSKRGSVQQSLAPPIPQPLPTVQHSTELNQQSLQPVDQSQSAKEPSPPLQQPALSVQQSSPYGSRQAFAYTPLSHPRNFRILHLQGDLSIGWKDQKLNGDLIEASLDNVPDYFALSYTWGDPAFPEKILLGGRELEITQNCANALRRMLKGKPDRVIWVDSICINQAGNAEALKERGGQVAMMDEIYSKATQVNVHLGPGDEKSNAAVAAIKQLTPLYLAAITEKAAGHLRESTRQRYEDFAAEVLATTPEFPYGKLHGLFRLPWFRRTWVLQEVALARKVMFYCGENLMALETLCGSSDFTRLPYSKLDAAALHWRVYLQVHQHLSTCIQRRKKGENVELRMSDLIYITFSLDATRPEDKIYGLYGCAKSLGLNFPVPDYTKSVAQVYTEAMLACLNEDDDINVLDNVEGSAAAQFGLPSWVPNFSGSSTRWSLTNPPKLNISGSRKNSTACGLSKSQWMAISGGTQLKVLGRRLDQVAAVGEPWKVDGKTTMLGDADQNSGQVYTSFIECAGSWLRIASQRNPKNAIRDLVHFLKTEHGLLTAAPSHIDESLSTLVNWQGASDEARLKLFVAQPGSTALGQYMGEAIQHVSSAMWKLVFRTTNNGYLGTGSYSSRPGDLIVVFHGMRLPCLIRPCEGGFSFVGAAWVEGIMDSEFWNASSGTSDEWFVLV